ncbi:MAG: TonB-dependent receptor [Paludibacteraceae bacterium]|nr:TonB-dependent receptor [Paludibacteraceae bacterium]
MIIRFFSLLVLLSSVLTAVAEAYTVRGRVIDAKTGETIPYANVELKSEDGSKSVQGLFTGDDGRFIMEGVEEAKYQLIVSFVGYSDYNGKITPEFLKREGGAKITIKLREDVALLSQVEVVGTRTQLQMDVDKKTFLVNEGATTVGVSATDVLRDIPTVDVDMDGNVSLRNNENVEVFINGRSVGLSGEAQGEMLEQFPAGSIEKIEVITNPSSKYSAEGSAGIINIVLKQDAPAGVFGNVTAGISYPSEGKLGGNLGASVNVTKNKWTILSSLGYQRRTFRGTSDIDREQFLRRDSLLRDTVYNITDGGRDFIINSYFARLGLDYKINDKNRIGLSGVFSLGKNRREENFDYEFGKVLGGTRIDTATSNRSASAKSPRNMYTVKFDYKHVFSEGRELSFLAQTASNSQDNDATYYQSRFDTLHNRVSYSEQQQSNERKIRKNQFAIDYTSPVGKISNLELGINIDLTNERNDAESFQRIDGTHPFVRQDNLTNDFEYIQNVYAWYGMWSGKVKRLSYKIGLRGELSDISWIQHNTGASDELDSYGNLFPSLFLSYNATENDELQFSAIRRITRPRGFRLNPNPNMSDSTTISYGNPDLHPEEAFSGEMNYLHTTPKGHVYTISAYYKFTDDVVEQYSWTELSADEKVILKSTFANLNRSHSTGMELIAKNKFKPLTLTTNVNLYYHKVVGGTTTIEVANANGILTRIPLDLRRREGFSWDFKEGVDFRLPKGITGQFTLNYRSPRVAAQGKSMNSFFMNIGLKRQFMEKKLSLSFNIRDIANSNKRNMETWSESFHQISKTTRNGRTFNLNASYSFGNNNNNGKKGERGGKSNMDDDMNFDDF